MSYLLEALRKSEQERQQQVPNLSTATTEWEDADAEPERSPWLMLIVAMLTIICLLLVFLVWKASTQNRPNVVEDRPLVNTNVNASETHSNETMNSPNTSSMKKESGVNTNSSVSKPVIAVREKPTLTVRTGNAAQIEVKIPTSRSAQSHALATSSQRGAEIISPTRAAVPQEQIKKAYDLDDTIRAQLPPMNMNSHIYSTDANASFVIINGGSLSVGQELAPGLSLVAITPDGAVLNFRGERFLLPSMSNFNP